MIFLKKGTLKCLFYCLQQRCQGIVYLLPGLLVSFNLYAAQVPGAGAINCPNPHFERQAKIKYVHDGDTVTLKNDEKIRLIGINSPELARRNRQGQLTKAEPFGKTARDYLKKRLRRNTIIYLQYGKVRKDHYGRSLAHIFLSNGEDIQLTMLQHGLASALVIPPDTTFAHCYHLAEEQARCQHTGLWADKKTILQSKRLKVGTTGFHLIQGKVKNITSNHQGIWIHLQGKLTLGIRPANLALFNKKLLRSYTGKIILARGWLNPGRNHSLYMRIRHPLAIELANKNTCP